MRSDIRSVPLPEPQELMVTLSPQEIVEKLDKLGAPIMSVDEVVEFLEREDRVLSDDPQEPDDG